MSSISRACSVLVFDGADEDSGFARELDGLHVAREICVGIDVDEPRGAEADHALVAVGEDLAGDVVVDPVGFEGAVDPPPVNFSDDFAVVDALGEGNGFAGEAALEAVAEVFDAE